MSRFVLPYADVSDSAGDPLSGAKLYFYASGTSTPQATYSDNARTTANTNPVVADSGGRFATIYLADATYKVVLKTSGDVTVWTADPVVGYGSTADLVSDGTITSDSFTGDGTTTAFTVSRTLTSGSGGLFVAVDGVTQAPSTYSLAGTTLTFTQAPPDDSVIDVRIVGRSVPALVGDSYTASGTGAVARSIAGKLADVVTVGDFGAVGDGVTSANAAIALMVTAVGYVAFGPGNFAVTTATIDAPVFFAPGAYVTVAAANTLTITGPVDSPKQHIFRGSGLVVLSSDSNSGEPSRRVHVSWFGAFPAASSQGDQAPAIQKALTAVGNTRESEIEFDFGNYHIFTAMTVTRGAHLKGAGTRRTVIRLNADGFDVFTTTEVAAKFSNLQFEVESPLTERLTGCYIRISHGECEVYDVQCYAGVQGIVVTGNNARIDNIVGTYGSSHAAGSSLVHIASGSGSRVSNVMAGTSAFGPEALVRIGGTGGGAVSGVLVENIQHVCPSASVHVEAFGGNIQRCNLRGINYNGSSGTAPTYAIKLATSSTYGINGVTLSDCVINSYATNGILFEQGSSGTLEDITLDGIDITGSSGIGIQFTRTAGTLKDIKVGDTVNAVERATPFGYSGTTSNIRISPMAIPEAGPAICYTSTIADDGVLTITLQRSVFTGVGILSCSGTHYGMFVVRAASSPAVTAMITASASVASTTGALTGTTGTDTKLTLSADVGVIYIENRLGSSQAVHFTLLTGN